MSAAPPAAAEPRSALAVPPPEKYFLPREYRQQTQAVTHDEAVQLDDRGEPIVYWNEERIRASARYQHHVYAWATQLVEQRGLKSVLDLGCGPCVKLTSLIGPVCDDTEGADQPSAIAAARTLGARANLKAIDLENCGDIAAWRSFDLVVCADVIEHLMDPDPMLGLINRLCHKGSLVLLSTPDRARLRGRACMASDKPEHVREWAEPEFLRLLRSRGFEVLRVRRLPGDDAPAAQGRWRELAFRLRLAGTSPHRCCTVLCRPARGS